MKDESKEKIQNICMVSCAIWRARNDLVWNNKRAERDRVLTEARVELNQWEEAQKRRIAHQPSATPAQMENRWLRPEIGEIKINVDGALFEAEAKFELAAVARNHEGQLVETIGACRRGVVAPELAKAIGVKEALSWIREKGWEKAKVETDCLNVVKAIEDNQQMESYFGGLISDIKLLLSLLPFVDVCFVKRPANKVAHSLARASYSMSERVYVWGSLPSTQ